jgi:ferredoxin-NADP reductase
MQTATRRDAIPGRGIRAPLPPPGARVPVVVTPNATLSARIDLTSSVARFRVRPDDGVPAFEPGQYLALGLPVDGRLLQRPYSTASAKGASEEVEFLIRRVPTGAFTPLLWELPVGARLRMGRPKGLFTMKPGDPRDHLFIATGTGLAPFVAMLETLLAGGGSGELPPRAVVVHGVSKVGELAYQERLERWASDGRDVAYAPAISRPDHPENAGWDGAVGRVDAILDALCEEHALDPLRTVAYLCGNPEMIAAGERILATRGFPPDAIVSEHYWPGQPAETAPTGQATPVPPMPQ